MDESRHPLDEMKPSGDGVETDHLREKMARAMFGEEEAEAVRIGRYVVIDRVGSGAAGVVFKAYDEDLDRLVAIKVLGRAVAEDVELRRTAMREGQSLAKLAHPHVVGIHEVGEHGGSLYFVMEFVRGGDLAHWIAEHDPLEPDDAAAALSLVLEAGRGLMAAHQAGIIHRDFKPANVLVDRDGRAKVADFGLARGGQVLGDSITRTGDTAAGSGSGSGSATEEGFIAGTPAYMPPERRIGESASEVTDQFAFCVTAWEALYGRRPWPGRPWAGKEQPTTPTGVSVAPSIRRALERGLSHDPTERWPSMEPLLEALEPRPSRVSSVATRGAAALAVAGVVAFAAFESEEEHCTGAAAKIESLWTPQRAAEIRDSVVLPDVPFTAEAWRTFEAGIEAYTVDWISMHTETCEATVVRKEQSSDAMDLRMACLGRARQALASTLSAFEGADRDVLVRTHRLVGGLPRLGECADLDALMADVPPPEAAQVDGVREVQAKLADARAQIQAGRFDAAKAAVELAQSTASAVDYPPLTAELELELGQVDLKRGEFESSIEHFEAAFNSAVRWNRGVLTLRAANQLSETHVRMAKTEPGLAYARMSLALSERPQTPPELRSAAHSLLGGVWRERGESERAIAEFREAYRVAADAFGEDHIEAVFPLSNAAATLYDQGKHREAIVEYERILAARSQALGTDHPDVGITLNALCTLRGAVNEEEAALADCRGALEIFEGALPPGHADIAMAKTNLSNALFDSGQQEAGLAMARDAVEGWVAAVGADHPNTGRARAALAISLAKSKQLDAALEEMTAARVIFEKSLGAKHPAVAQARTTLGSIAFEAGEYAKALEIHEANRPLLISALGEEHPLFASAELARGQALAQLGRTEDARTALENALAIRIKSFGEDSTKLKSIRDALAGL